MSSNVDVQGALALLDEIGPTLADEERVLRAAEPQLSTAESLARVLRSALARRRAEVSRETFVYLHWRVEREWHATPAGRATFAAARPARAETPWLGSTRLVCDPAGRRWAVRETTPNDLFGAASPHWLVFRSAGEERRTSVYEPSWASLPDAALLALLPAS
jgi:hypothetical protein